MEKPVFCLLTINRVRPYDGTDDYCNVSCTTPNECGVGFIIKDCTNLKIGDKLPAICRNSHLTSAACNYELLPYWDGNEIKTVYK